MPEKIPISLYNSDLFLKEEFARVNQEILDLENFQKSVSIPTLSYVQNEVRVARLSADDEENQKKLQFKQNTIQPKSTYSLLPVQIQSLSPLQNKVLQSLLSQSLQTKVFRRGEAFGDAEGGFLGSYKFLIGNTFNAKAKQGVAKGLYPMIAPQSEAFANTPRVDNRSYFQSQLQSGKIGPDKMGLSKKQRKNERRPLEGSEASLCSSSPDTNSLFVNFYLSYSKILFNTLNKKIRKGVSREFLFVAINLILFGVLAIIQRSNYGKGAIFTWNTQLRNGFSKGDLCKQGFVSLRCANRSVLPSISNIFERKSNSEDFKSADRYLFSDEDSIDTSKLFAKLRPVSSSSPLLVTSTFYPCLPPCDKYFINTNIKTIHVPWEDQKQKQVGVFLEKPDVNSKKPNNILELKTGPWHIIKALTPLNNKSVAIRFFAESESDLNTEKTKRSLLYNKYDKDISRFQYCLPFYVSKKRIFTESDTIPSKRDTIHYKSNYKTKVSGQSLQKSMDPLLAEMSSSQQKYVRSKGRQEEIFTVSQGVLKRCFYKYGVLLLCFARPSPTSPKGLYSEKMQSFALRPLVNLKDVFASPCPSSLQSEALQTDTKNEVFCKHRNGLHKDPFGLQKLRNPLWLQNFVLHRIALLIPKKESNSLVLPYKESNKNELPQLFNGSSDKTKFLPSFDGKTNHNVCRHRHVLDLIPTFNYISNNKIINVSVSGYQFPELDKKEITYLFRKKAVIDFARPYKHANNQPIFKNRRYMSLHKSAPYQNLIFTSTGIVRNGMQNFVLQRKAVAIQTHCALQTQRGLCKSEGFAFLSEYKPFGFVKRIPKTTLCLDRVYKGAHCKSEVFASNASLGHTKRKAQNTNFRPETTFLKQSRVFVPSASKNFFKDLQMQYTQVNLDEISESKALFEKMGRDYENYLRQPKDSLPALIISPSLEDDREIEEEGIRIFNKRDFIKSQSLKHPESINVPQGNADTQSYALRFTNPKSDAKQGNAKTSFSQATYPESDTQEVMQIGVPSSEESRIPSTRMESTESLLSGQVGTQRQLYVETQDRSESFAFNNKPEVSPKNDVQSFPTHYLGGQIKNTSSLSATEPELEGKELSFVKSKNDFEQKQNGEQDFEANSFHDKSSSTFHQNRVANALRQAEEEIDNIAKREEKAIEKNKQAIPPLTRLEALYTIRNQEKKHEQAKDFTSCKSLRNSIKSKGSVPFSKDAIEGSTSRHPKGSKKESAVKSSSLPIFDELFLYSDQDKFLNKYGCSKTKYSIFNSSQPSLTWIFSNLGDANLCTDRKHSFFGEVSLLSKKLTAKEQKQLFQQKADPLFKNKAETYLSWDISDSIKAGQNKLLRISQSLKKQAPLFQASAKFNLERVNDLKLSLSSRLPTHEIGSIQSPQGASMGMRTANVSAQANKGGKAKEVVKEKLPFLQAYTDEVYSIAATVPLSLLSQLSIHSKANKKNSETTKFQVGTINTTGTTFLTRPSLIKSPQSIFASLNRIYFHDKLSQNKACQASTPKIKDTPLESPVSHRVWQAKRIEPSTFRMHSRNKSTSVIPRICQKDWRNIMEWQLKKHFFEEDKRLLPLYSAISSQSQSQSRAKLGVRPEFSKGQNKKLKIKKVNLYLPWISIKKGDHVINNQTIRLPSTPQKSKSIEWPLTRLDLTEREIKGDNLIAFSKDNFRAPRKEQDTPRLYSNVYPIAKAEDLINALRLPISREVAFATKMQNSCFAEFGHKIASYWRLPIQQNFLTSKNHTYLNSFQASSLRKGGDKMFIAHEWKSEHFVLLQSILFESVTKYSWLFIYTLFFGCLFKQLFKFIYKVGLRDFFIKFLHSDFGRAITSEEFRDSIQNPPFSEIYMSKKRLSELLGLGRNKAQLLEIVWFLRNNCVGRNGPRGILLVGPPGVENVSVVQAIAGEAAVPIIIQSLEKIAADNEPQRQLEQLYTRAQKQAPCILFLDQLDNIGTRRDQLFTDNKRGHNWSSLTSSGVDKSIIQEDSSEYSNKETGNKLNIVLRLLTILDGINQSTGVVTVATAQNITKLDPALLRPKRFDRRIYLSLPNRQDRVQLFKVQTQSIGHMEAHSYAQPLTPLFAEGLQKRSIANPLGLHTLRGSNASLAMNHFFDAHGMMQSEASFSREPRIPFARMKSTEMPWDYLSLRTENMSAADIRSAINYSLFRAVQQKSVHTVETLEYGIDCVKTLTDKRLQKTK